MDARLDDGWEAIDDLDPMMGGGWWDDHNRGLMDLHQLRNGETKCARNFLILLDFHPFIQLIKEIYLVTIKIWEYFMDSIITWQVKLLSFDKRDEIFNANNSICSGQNEWNDNAHLQRQRVQQIASKIPTVILQE